MKDKKVKIVATTGPSVDSEEMIFNMAEAGVDVFRINLSHASKDEIQTRTKWVRAAEKKLGRPLTVMGDLAGPKIRLGDVEEGVVLTQGEQLKIYKETIVGNCEGFSLNHKEIVASLTPGAEIYIDDGKLKLQVEKKEADGVIASVLVGGSLKPRKGFSAEGLSLSSVGLSAKDKADIASMLEVETDALAVSFVQNAKDILAVKKLLPKDKKIFIVAKIETAQGIANAEEILEEADALMVARGDMGLAIPIAQVPHIQKSLINLCLKKAKPVITATQMLESMISAPLPTRAEVTDVANAILDGTDAIMLSAESAQGAFPLEAVKMMMKIIHESLSHIETRSFHDEKDMANAVSSAAGEVADQIGADLIVSFTESGSTTRRISRHRHPKTILALSPLLSTVRNLNFSWGVHPRLIKASMHFDHMREQAKEFAAANGVLDLKKDEAFVIVAGMPFGESGTTNMILVEKV